MRRAFDRSRGGAGMSDHDYGIVGRERNGMVHEFERLFGMS